MKWKVTILSIGLLIMWMLTVNAWMNFIMNPIPIKILPELNWVKEITEYMAGALSFVIFFEVITVLAFSIVLIAMASKLDKLEQKIKTKELETLVPTPPE